MLASSPGPGLPFSIGRSGRGCLEDAFTAAAGIFGAEMADHLEPRGDLLQHLGRVFAKLAELATDATVAINLWFVHHDLARQMIRQRLAHGDGAALMFANCLRCDSGDPLRFVLFKVLQPQLRFDQSEDRTR